MRRVISVLLLLSLLCSIGIMPAYASNLASISTDSSLEELSKSNIPLQGNDFENHNAENCHQMTEKWFSDKQANTLSCEKCPTEIGNALNAYFSSRETGIKEKHKQSKPSKLYVLSDELECEAETSANRFALFESNAGILVTDAQTTVFYDNDHIVYNKDHTISVFAYEWTFFDYTDKTSKTADSDVSGYGIYHKITVADEKVDNRIQILTDEYDASDIFGICTMNDTTKNELTQLKWTPKDNDSEIIDQLAYLEEHSGSGDSTQGFYSSYNPSAVAAYADQYVYHGAQGNNVYENYYNSAYYNYNPLGGDCTNYTSQCIYAGGMPQVVCEPYGTSGWYYKTSSNRSATWTNQIHLRNWMSSNRGTLATATNSTVYVGSPVIYNTEHSTICVGQNSSGVPIINSHNYDRYHVVWNYWGDNVTYTTVQLTPNNNYSPNHYLDINGRLLSGYGDGEYEDKDNIANWGTCDVYINGSLVANDVTDYYTQWPKGTTYEITDIKGTGLRTYYWEIGSLTGTIGDSDVSIRLIFQKINLVCDTDPINLKPNEGVWVRLSTKYGDQVDQITCYASDSSIAAVTSDSIFYNTNGEWVYVRGVNQGDTRLYCTYVKGNQAAALTVPIHVSGSAYDRYLSLSDWDIELIGDVAGYGFSKYINITCPGTYPTNYYLSYEIADPSLLNIWTGEWNGNSMDVEFLAVYPAVEGSTQVHFYLHDSATNNIVDSATINVTVSDIYNVNRKGVYELHREQNGKWSGKVLSNFYGNVQLANDLSGSSKFARHLWVFERQDDKTYIIRNLYDNTYLVPESNYNDYGCNVITTTEYPDSRAKRWALKAHPDGGNYLCLATINGLVLDIDNASMEVGANAQLWGENGSTAQNFMFDKWNEISEPIESFTPETPYAWSYYDGDATCAFVNWTESPVITEDGAFDSRSYEVEVWDLTNAVMIDYFYTDDPSFMFWDLQPGHNYRVWLRAVNNEFDHTRVPYTCSSWTYTDFSVPIKPVNPFVDVKEGKYYYDAVLWAFYHDPQITGGTDATHFSPNKTCTREQIVTFLWKAMGAPEPFITVNPFSDVKNDKYYYKAVLWAVQNGITGGVENGKFGVGKSCTREQAMTFLWKACDSPEPKTTTSPFSDVKAGKYYYKAILWAVENDITGGIGNGKFGVGKTCTRGQIVTFLYKLLT